MREALFLLALTALALLAERQLLRYAPRRPITEERLHEGLCRAMSAGLVDAMTLVHRPCFTDLVPVDDTLPQHAPRPVTWQGDGAQNSDPMELNHAPNKVLAFPTVSKAPSFSIRGHIKARELRALTCMRCGEDLRTTASAPSRCACALPSSHPWGPAPVRV